LISINLYRYVKYSPDDARLAVASRDQTVDVYLVGGCTAVNPVGP
jgi:hypothetical protein